jgi:hypothetical protein
MLELATIVDYIFIGMGVLVVCLILYLLVRLSKAWVLGDN